MGTDAPTQTPPPPVGKEEVAEDPHVAEAAEAAEAVERGFTADVSSEGADVSSEVADVTADAERGADGVDGAGGAGGARGAGGAASCQLAAKIESRAGQRASAKPAAGQLCLRGSQGPQLEEAKAETMNGHELDEVLWHRESLEDQSKQIAPEVRW